MNNSDPLIQKIKRQLDQQPLSEDIQQQLAAARRQALQQPQSVFLIRHATAVTSFASIMALALAVALMLTPSQDTLPMQNIEAFEIITSNEPLEMYQELEFYLWLDEQPRV